MIVGFSCGVGFIWSSYATEVIQGLYVFHRESSVHVHANHELPFYCLLNHTSEFRLTYCSK